MNHFDNPAFDDHEGVHHFFDRRSGLRAIVAIHSTRLGPAAGGCRRWHYANDESALGDALRLSRGMTYKNALAGIPFGGGKCVLLCEPGESKSPMSFRALGAAIDSLGGRYITAEDVGVSARDMCEVKKRTDYVAGLPQAHGEVGGDPSPWTALGVALCIGTAARRALGTDTLQGTTIAVQGVGHVGFHLCRLLAEAGARLIVADVNPDNVKRAVELCGARAVSPGQILFQRADILAPCALGAVLNARTIPGLRCRVVAGAANNQLETAEDARRLQAQGILFAPDYVINAGGIVCVAREYLGGCSPQQLADEIRRIPDRLEAILEKAESTDRPPPVVADEAAEAVVRTHSRFLPFAARPVRSPAAGQPQRPSLSGQQAVGRALG